MSFVQFHKYILRPMALAGLLAGVTTLHSADAPTDAAPAPPPAPATPPAGTWYVFAPPKEGVVLSPALREKLLTLVKGFTERSNPTQVAHLKAAANPFYPALPPTPIAVPVAAGAVTTATPAASAAPVQASALEKLQQVADQLKPTGALIGGQNRLIIFANGGTLGVGQSILVTFPGDSIPTAVILQDVSSDSFTLKLGDIGKAFPFVAKASSARPNSAPTPSKPKP